VRYALNMVYDILPLICTIYHAIDFVFYREGCVCQSRSTPRAAADSAATPCTHLPRAEVESLAVPAEAETETEAGAGAGAGAERDMNELSVVQGPTCGAEPGELIEPEIDEEQWAAVDPLDDVAILRNFYEQHPG
jgi:hypothetical protein